MVSGIDFFMSFSISYIQQIRSQKRILFSSMKTIMILSTIPDERLEMVLLESNKLGYRSVFCKRMADGEARSEANVEYTADWEDTEALVKISLREKIDGIVALVDAAVLPASRVSEALGLPGNSPESMQCLLSKDAFRTLQDRAGVFAPRHFLTEREDDAVQRCSKLRFPVIVKPLLASSSFGQTVLSSKTGIAAAFRTASGVSRNGQVCIEEFIRQGSLCGIELDIFVVGSDIIWDGIRYSWRAENAALRPVCDVYPAELNGQQWKELRDTVRTILKTAGVRLGQYNIEGFFTKEGRFFVIEINPRQSGYYNPQQIELYCGVNLTKLLVTTAVSDPEYYRSLASFRRIYRNLIAYSIFSEEEGILDEVYIAPELQSHLIDHRYLHGVKKGDVLRSIRDAVRPVSVASFSFDTAQELEEIRARIDELVYVKLFCTTNRNPASCSERV